MQRTYIPFWARKTFCLITGANKGLGEGLAYVFSQKLAPKSGMVLVANNETGLKAVKSKIVSSRPDLKIFTWNADLCKVDGEFFKQHFINLFKENDVKESSFLQSLLIHNAGSAGNLSLKLTEQTDKSHLDDYWALNLTSAILLNSVFFSFFTKNITPHRTVVHISSDLATNPVKVWGPYCAGKAARNVLFKVMSMEEPDIRVLTYVPGPVNTEMFQRALDETSDEDTLNFFKGRALKSLTCEESSQKLARILSKDVYKKGAILDYHDINRDGNPYIK